MPGLITHYICGDITLKRLENHKVSNMLEYNRQLYNIGTQGPDVFFYYLPCLYKKSLFQLGNRIHKTKVGDFLCAIMKHIDEIHDKQERYAAASYFAGYLTHYALDVCAHPYIYYMSGFKQPNDGAHPLKHSVSHRNFETNIDILILKIASSEKPSDKKLWHLIKVTYHDAKSTSSILSKSLEEVYHIKLSKKQVYNAIYSMYTANMVMQSSTGKRKSLMEFVESHTFKENIISSLIHDQHTIGGVDYLNTKKSLWHYPWENETENNHSFGELFEDAVNQGVVMIDAEFAFLKKEISIEEFQNIVGKKSLATGRDCDLHLPFKYMSKN